MKKALIPAAAALLALAPVMSLAQTTGTFSNQVIASVNESAGTVTLQDGSQFEVLPAAYLNALHAGSAVSFIWQDVDGRRVITSVKTAH